MLQAIADPAPAPGRLRAWHMTSSAEHGRRLGNAAEQKKRAAAAHRVENTRPDCRQRNRNRLNTRTEGEGEKATEQILARAESLDVLERAGRREVMLWREPSRLTLVYYRL